MSVSTSETSVSSLLEEDRLPSPPRPPRAARRDVLGWAQRDSVEAAACAEGCSSPSESEDVALRSPGVMQLRLAASAATAVRCH